VSDVRREGAAPWSRSAAVHPCGEHRRPGPGGRGRTAPRSQPTSCGMLCSTRFR
jgi:hypothetical protein